MTPHTHVVLLSSSPIPVPTGWRYTAPAVLGDMPGVERDVGGYNLTVGLDDGEWRWWLCIGDSPTSIERGNASDMVAALFQVLDAAVRRLDSDSKQTAPVGV